MYGTLRATTVFFALLLTLSNILSIGYIVSTGFENQQRIVSARASGQRLAEEIIPLGGLLKDIQIDVIQVQQFLTDFSATRGEDGLDGGLEEAAKFAAEFRRHVAAATEIGRRIGRDDLVAVLGEALTAFEPYRSTGEKMAKTYAHDGTGAGNAMMPSFDEASEALQKRIDRLAEVRDELIGAAASGAAGDLVALGDAVETSSHTAAVVAGFVVLVSIGFAVVMVRRAIRPIGRLAGVMRHLAEGAVDVAVPHTDRRDEIGEIARATDVFREAIAQREAMRHTAEVEEARRRDERRQERQALADGFAASIAGAVAALNTAAGEIARDARSLDAIAGTASTRAGEAAAAVGRTDGNVASVADAAARLAAAIGEVERQMHRAEAISETAAGQAGRTHDIVHDLSSSADRIGEIVGLINAVAAQTNLLALNATIEAARAGESGRGFAVVAAEVKELAAQTARATEQIAVQIGNVQSITGNAVDAIDAIGRTVGEITAITRAIMAAVEEQGTATREISRSIGEASQDTRGVVADIAAVDESTRSTSKAVASMVEASDRLTDVAGRLKTDADGFVARIRA
jgi:methyl-accepting chemotaxis protein